MANNNKVTVKRVFGSLVNNATAIDGAKFSPWWVGLILFIFGLILPILPLFVQSATTDGTSFMSSCEYGLGMDKTFGEAINSLDGTLTFNKADSTISYTPNSTYNENDTTMIGGYISTAGACSGQYELRIYYENTIVNEDSLSAFVSRKQSISYKKGTTTVSDINDDASTKYIPSSVYFFKNAFYVDIYASNSTDKKTYMPFISDLEFFEFDGGDLKAYFCGSSFNKDNKEDRLKAVDQLKVMMDETYHTTKVKAMWLGSLIYMGIYTAVNVFMILMIFLMSRGKNNPNNYLSFWTCTKIDWWASFCPGLLGMILGFIFTNFATMAYVMLLCMRTMWLTMREMRPQL